MPKTSSRRRRKRNLHSWVKVDQAVRPLPPKTLSILVGLTLTLSYRGGGGKIRPLLFFLHHPKTAEGIKQKLSDFKDTPLRHILQVKPVRSVLSCCHGNKIKEGTLQDLAPRKSEKSAICKDIELKFGIETNFGPLS